jgi:hypothetical protein
MNDIDGNIPLTIAALATVPVAAAAVAFVGYYVVVALWPVIKVILICAMSLLFMAAIWLFADLFLADVSSYEFVVACGAMTLVGLLLRLDEVQGKVSHLERQMRGKP